MKPLLIAAVVLFSVGVFAQTADEALRYSELRFGGTARGVGVAGAFGAIGADYTSIISNPGGLALLRQSEFMFTFSLDNINVDTRYDGSHSRDDRFNFNLPNIGVVIAGKKKKESDWKFTNFGIGYNRLANFNSNFYYRSLGTDNSILKSYANELDGIPANELEYGGNYSLESVLAYDAYLLNPVSGNNSQYTTVTDNASVNQQISIEKRGAIDELSFSVASNYRDKVYFGGYLGIPFLYYREKIRHAEQNKASDSDAFNSFEQNQRLNTFGIGINFKMGLIYRPVDWLRLGAAFHTPTFYGVNDDYSSSVESSFDTAQYFPDEQIGEFHYNLVTPARFVGSVGFVAKKLAFVSFDYERVNYGSARYKMESAYTDFEMDLNDDIDLSYTAANVYRTGVEFALDKFRLRGGFAHYDSPLETTLAGDYDGAVNYYTFGAGVRLRKVYLDFAYIRSHSKAITFAVNEELAQDEITGNRFMLTTGFRF